MATNYQKGVRKEYRIVNKLKSEGWDIVQRSAGSHSPIDIWAVNKLTRVIKLIQVKPDDYNAKKEIFKMRWLNNVFRVEFEVI